MMQRRVLHFEYQSCEITKLMKRYFDLMGMNLSNQFKFDADSSIEFHQLAREALNYYRFNSGANT